MVLGRGDRGVPEHTIWILCGTGPMQDEYHVKQGGKVLRVFHVSEAAEKYRWWMVRGEYKRLAAARRGDEESSWEIG